MFSFNLLTEPWIPVRPPDGGPKLVSLDDALLNARAYRRIEDPSPLVTAAVHRLLITVLHRALEGPERSSDAATWFRDGFPEAMVRAYLAEWRSRFDLFDPQAPFYQLPDLPLEGFTDHWTRLSAERGNGNTSFLFNHALRDRAPKPHDPIPPDEAARRLLEHQTFALGGLIKRFITSSPAAPVATAALVIAQGENLHETLCLNLAPYPRSVRELDSPVWERPPLRVPDLHNGASAPVRGLTDRYTWFSRSIRLQPERDGDRTVVRFIAYAAGVSPSADAGRDPMVAYVKDKDDNPRPLGFREGRGLWRDFQALVPRRGGNASAVPNVAVLEHATELMRALTGRYDHPVQAAVLGLANDKAKLKLYRAERHALPPVALSDFDVHGFVRARLDAAEDTGRALNSAGRALAARLLTRGDRQPHKDDVTRLNASLPHAAHYWTTLERAFPAFLNDLPPDADALETRQRALEAGWNTTLERTARRAFDLAAVGAGDDARALRAVEGARSLLEKHLAGRRREQEG